MNRKRGYKSDLRAQRAAATRELIIKTAAEAFVPWSTDVPFDQLAERAGISVRTVFRHFVRTPADFAKFQAGEVLVATATAPA